MLSAMDAELFDSELLESCRRDDARELQTVYFAVTDRDRGLEAADQG